jgi:hypothetical protein
LGLLKTTSSMKYHVKEVQVNKEDIDNWTSKPRLSESDEAWAKANFFSMHRCWACDDGSGPCKEGHYRNCSYPYARND